MEHHESISKTSARKLEELASFIEQVPRRQFNMNYWAAKGKDYQGEPNFHTLVCPTALKEDLEHPCGTMCCIAGWQVIRKGMCILGNTVYKNFKQAKLGRTLGSPPDVAAQQLGLETYQATRLYHPSHWPENESAKGYWGMDSDKRPFTRFKNTPKGAAKRIRHFIRTGE